MMVRWAFWLVVTIGWFLLWELPAVFNQRPGDTLSEAVWRVLRVGGDKRSTWLTWLGRGALMTLLAWLCVHLGMGWLA
jgi:hypothetical protein